MHFSCQCALPKNVSQSIFEHFTAYLGMVHLGTIFQHIVSALGRSVPEFLVFVHMCVTLCALGYKNMLQVLLCSQERVGIYSKLTVICNLFC